jgi:hypothetical protein
MNQPAVIETDNTEIISNLVLNGDIKKMNQIQRVQYYNALCKSLELNPLTQPFQIITLSGKEVLYATRTATDQLRKINGISIDTITQKFERDICITTVTAHDKTGRVDGATGAVSVGGLKGDALCNAIMKSETKAKRRVTLSISGLGIIDESEIETIPNAEVKKMTIESGTMQDEPKSLPIGEIAAANGKIDSIFDAATLAGVRNWLNGFTWTKEDRATIKTKLTAKEIELMNKMKKGA